MLNVYVFNVELGQCIYIFPTERPEYCAMIDCGNTSDFDPIDGIINQKLLFINGNEKILGSLIITNYDQDHFSGLPYLMSKVKIKSVMFSNNLSSIEILRLKDESTEPIRNLCYLKDNFNSPINNWNPPYSILRFYLQKEDIDDYDTNKLSQIVFINYKGKTICIPGDIPNESWKIILEKEKLLPMYLEKTNIFFASHHGREDGYCENVFKYCTPDCIIISDEKIKYETQEDMVKKYEKHVSNGIFLFNMTPPVSHEIRKVLTTRNDGNIYIGINEDGNASYEKF